MALFCNGMGTGSDGHKVKSWHSNVFYRNIWVS